jgi:hypothetical protein
MDLDDYLEPEVAIAVAVTAVVASPPLRKAVRKGAVYGLAGLLLLGDRVRDLAANLAQAARQQRDRAGAAPDNPEEQPAPQPAGT